MKFLVDAQLPRRLANWLNQAGHDTLHILDLPKKNLTSDNDLVARAVRNSDGCNKRSALHRMLVVTHPTQARWLLRPCRLDALNL